MKKTPHWGMWNLLGGLITAITLGILSRHMDRDEMSLIALSIVLFPFLIIAIAAGYQWFRRNKNKAETDNGGENRK